MKTPKLDDDFMEQVHHTQREMKKKSRASYLKEHLFDILNLAIAILALLVAVLGLYLPKSEQPTQVQSDPKGQYQTEGQFDDIGCHE